MEVQLSKELKQLCSNTSNCTDREKKLLDGIATAMKVGACKHMGVLAFVGHALYVCECMVLALISACV